MYELVQVAENTYYINSPSKVGIYRVNDGDVWLIDSGNDKDAGRKIQKIFDAQGWTLTAITNTHSNADHDGGNTLLQNVWAALFMPRRWKRRLWNTRYWSRPFFTAAIHSKNCGTSF